MARSTRRQFLGHASALGAALALSPAARAVSANDQVRHASFGAGGMAGADLRALSRHPNLKLVAVCDVDAQRLGKLKEEFPEIRVYTDFRKLLDAEEGKIDSVNVSTPDHMHAKIALAAMERGKHVYCQKPLAQNLFEVRQLKLAAQKSKVVTQMGIQIHSHVAYRSAVALIQTGTIGKVREVHSFSNKRWGDNNPRPDRQDAVPAHLNWDLWLGVATDRPFIGNGYYHPGNWRKRLDFGTGTFGDMGCHIYDPVFKALGVNAPSSVYSQSPKPNEHNWATDAKIRYTFPGSKFTTDPVTVTWYDGDQQPPAEVLAQLGDVKKPGQGSIFIGEQGVMLLPHIGMPQLLPADKFAGVQTAELAPRDHWASFVDAILGKERTSAHFDYSAGLTEAVLLGGVATHFPEQELTWDSENLTFRGNEAATALVRRDYRKGWEIEAVS